MRITLSWIMAAFSIWGMVLNINKNKYCFIVFGFTNLAWVIYFGFIHEWAPCFLQFVFLCSSVWGLVKWHKEG